MSWLFLLVVLFMRLFGCFGSSVICAYAFLYCLIVLIYFSFGGLLYFILVVCFNCCGLGSLWVWVVTLVGGCCLWLFVWV